MADTPPSAIRRLVAEERWGDVRSEDGVFSTLPPEAAPTSPRFEGVYGRIYTRTVQTQWIRRLVFRAWGGAQPVVELERFVADAVAADAADERVLLDVPSGGGTLLPLLAGEGLRGTVVEIDIASRMLERAVALARQLEPAYETVFLRSDALDLPLRPGIADLVISINGLHVVPDPVRFAEELARVTRPDGQLWLVTPVAARSVRSRAILGAARRLGITPGSSPSRHDLKRLLAAAGWAEFRDYGGDSIAGLALTRTRG
jgi:SAM-dependent methyltransferase